MNARPHGPRAAITWLLEGFALLRKQPLQLISVVFLFFMLLLFFLFMPFPISLLLNVLTPGLMAGLLYACAVVERGERLLPTALTAAFFTADRSRAKPLLLLGVLYIGVSFLSFGALSLVTDLDQLFKQLASAKSLPLLLLLNIVSIPLLTLMYYPPLLVAWHGVSPPKAVFFSLIALWRNLIPLLMLGLVMQLLTALASAILIPLASLIALAFKSNVLIVVLFFAVALTLIALIICCIHVSARRILDDGSEPTALATDKVTDEHSDT
ncbi:MAG: hypothetical protein EPO06_10425 [Burkholderiaceae bacterium]|nr:MAG: hypothetical protein EPO06_10425 [Burkholderiaceae bacterium]